MLLLTSDPMEAKSHSSSGILLNLKNIQPVIKAPMIFLLRLLTKSSDVIFYVGIEECAQWSYALLLSSPIQAGAPIAFLQGSEVADGSRQGPILGMALWGRE